MLEKTQYIECIKCGDRIPVDTHSIYTPCECGAIAVDGNCYYTRVIGEYSDWKSIPEREDNDD